MIHAQQQNGRRWSVSGMNNAAQGFASSNSTVNKFLGGRQKSWMVGGVRSSVAATPSGVEVLPRQKPPAPTTGGVATCAQRALPNIGFVESNISPSPSRPGQELHRPQGSSVPTNPVVADHFPHPQVTSTSTSPLVANVLVSPSAANANHNTNQSSVLPSPAPSDESRSALVNYVDLDDQRQGDQAEGIPVTSEGLQHPATVELNVLADANLDHMTSSISQIEGPPGEHQIVGEPNLEFLADTNRRRSLDPPTSESLQKKQRTDRPASIQPPPPPQPPSQVRAMSTSTNYQSPYSSQTPSLRDFLGTLDAYIANIGGEQRLSEVIELPRVKLLREACNEEDCFYLALHQTFCLNTCSPAELVRLPGFNLDQILAFGILGQLLMHNNHLPERTIKFFATFPCPIAGLLQRSPIYQSALQQVSSFLALLAQRWGPMQEIFKQRAYPPLVDELVMELGLTSPVFQRIVFTAVNRTLGGSEQSDGGKADALFRGNQQSYEQRIQRMNSDRPVTVAEMQAENDRLARELQNLRYYQLEQGRLRSQDNPHALQAILNAQHAIHQAQVISNIQGMRSAAPTFPHAAYQGGSPVTALPPNAQYQAGSPQSTTPVFPAPHRRSTHTAGIPIPLQSPHFQSNNQGPPANGNGLLLQSNASPPQPTAFLASGFPLQLYQPQQNVQQQQQQNGQRQQVPRRRGRPPKPRVHPHLVQPNQITSSHRFRLSPSIPSPVNGATPSPRSSGPSNGSTFVRYHNGSGPFNQGQTWRNQSQQNFTFRPPPRPLQTGSQSQQYVQPLLPKAGQVPIETIHPNTSLVALHQAHLKSPISRNVNGQGIADQDGRMYQYLRTFTVFPESLGSEGPAFAWNFRLSSLDLRRKVVDKPANERRPVVRLFKDGSELYRLRCIRVPSPKHACSESMWVVADSVWPSTCYIHINGQELEVRRKYHHGKDLPLDLTPYVREGVNELTFGILRTSAERDRQFYALAVEVVEVADHQRVKSPVQIIPSEQSLESIKKSLGSAANDEDLAVVDDHITIDIVDPFTAKMFDEPVRGKDCLHRECFDLETFLQTRKCRAPGGPTMPEEWKCPICGRDARPQSLVVDSFLRDVRGELQKTGQTDAKAVLVKADGSWSAKAEKKDDSKAMQGSLSAARDASVGSGDAAMVSRQESVVIELDD